MKLDVFSIISLLGGLAFFLYGMHVMSSGLEKIAGGKMEHMLRTVASHRMLSLFLGAGITIAIQSSSALTVMLVGLVNSGILSFGQTIGVLMGSNIGTTLTAWILSLSGLESDNVLLNLLKPEYFSLLFALAGVIMVIACQSQKKKSIGNIAVGFAILMYGMKVMSTAMSPLADMPEFTNLLTAFRNPILAVLFGAVFTGIIQSSAASVGILQALSLTGSISYNMAIPIVMGQNIGTCVTALISSIGVQQNAKKVAVVHLSFNIIGTLACLIPFLLIQWLIPIAWLDNAISPMMIALVHSIFNILTTILLFPFAKQLEKLANYVIRTPKQAAEEPVLLDERLLKMPAFAIAKAMNVTVEMADLARNAVSQAMRLLTDWNRKAADEIASMEDALDHYEDVLGTYLVKLSHTEFSDADNQQVARILHSINDFERLGDHAKNLIAVAEELHEKHITFSEEATLEMQTLTAAILEIVSRTVQAFDANDLQLATSVEPLEQVIDQLILEIKNRHILRLQKGNCTIELGFILTDLLTNYERISDHCSNIAIAVIEAANDSFEAHSYLHAMKDHPSQDFHDQFVAYSEQFAIRKLNE